MGLSRVYRFVAILSFIGVAVQLISGLASLLTASITDTISNVVTSGLENLDRIEGMKVEGAEKLTQYTNEASSTLTVLGYVNIVAALVCLLGLIWMWSLKKRGFFVYVIGEISAPVAIILLVENMDIFSSTSIIVSIIFILLWGLNLKNMK